MVILRSLNLGDVNYFYLMRNVINSPSKYVLRKYDLKGSTVDRSVLEKDKNADVNKNVLKDMDFRMENLENGVV